MNAERQSPHTVTTRDYTAYDIKKAAQWAAFNDLVTIISAAYSDRDCPFLSGFQGYHSAYHFQNSNILAAHAPRCQAGDASLAHDMMSLPTRSCYKMAYSW
jgi:hypothetical protein